MRFEPTLTPAILIRRYKRFLADVLIEGATHTVHCPNTGAMLGCADPGSEVWLAPSTNPARRTAYTWELVRVASGVVVGVNTGRANALVREAIEMGQLPNVDGSGLIRSEVRFGEENSRVDLVVIPPAGQSCFVEVKNVTAVVDDGVALFPDAVSARGTKHLRELSRIARAGESRAIMVYCVQRTDIHEVRPADSIDPAYGAALREALASGVEAYALRGEPSAAACTLDTIIPVNADVQLSPRSS